MLFYVSLQKRALEISFPKSSMYDVDRIYFRDISGEHTSLLACVFIVPDAVCFRV